MEKQAMLLWPRFAPARTSLGLGPEKASCADSVSDPAVVLVSLYAPRYPLLQGWNGARCPSMNGRIPRLFGILVGKMSAPQGYDCADVTSFRRSAN